MNNKGQYALGTFIIMVIFLVLVIGLIDSIEPPESLESKCMRFCQHNSEIYYESTHGLYANNVCICENIVTNQLTSHFIS